MAHMMRPASDALGMKRKVEVNRLSARITKPPVKKMSIVRIKKNILSTTSRFAKEISWLIWWIYSSLIYFSILRKTNLYKVKSRYHCALTAIQIYSGAYCADIHILRTPNQIMYSNHVGHKDKKICVHYSRTCKYSPQRGFHARSMIDGCSCERSCNWHRTDKRSENITDT